ncbi:MAG: zinc-ribbon domain-containing protein [Candidatus Viridilinea halotolerans]|uniref:Zinc-ribbon domain-containing protein n=1 Tax=Candidatus Viridilinea halotolerans TaxID=2491704 RepID=A0A426TS34_9CHLR|nr:MAG: zinc-ribbon domain-containing protein [Candidatus Viridilinea halotolerans]
MQDRDQLKEKLKRLQVINMTINAVLKYGLADVLFDDEIIEHLTLANFNKEMGALVLSDKRLFFLPYKKQNNVIEFDRTHISSASHSSGWISGQITLTISDITHQFNDVVDLDIGESFTKTLNRIGVKQNKANEATSMRSISDVLPAPSEKVEQLVNEGISALRKGEKDKAQNLLMAAIRLNRNHEQAWLWLSGAVSSDAERRKCLEMVLSINPQNHAAIKGLSLLPPPPPPPSPPEVSTHANHVQVITEIPSSSVHSPVRTEYCRHCGKSILVDSKFCSYCGQTLAPTTVIQHVIATQESAIPAPKPTPKKSTLGYGTLHIIASGAAEIIAEDIADAESVKSAILEAL